MFNISETAFIDTILKNPVFQRKNEKGHSMYSTALKHLKKYIGYYYDLELQAELLKEELEFVKYLIENPADVRKNNIEENKKELEILREKFRLYDED